MEEQIAEMDKFDLDRDPQVYANYLNHCANLKSFRILHGVGGRDATFKISVSQQSYNWSHIVDWGGTVRQRGSGEVDMPSKVAAADGIIVSNPNPVTGLAPIPIP
nr:hypothetical protein Iba_chr02eCG4010 [Ipomoea batatas]